MLCASVGIGVLIVGVRPAWLTPCAKSPKAGFFFFFFFFFFSFFVFFFFFFSFFFFWKAAADSPPADTRQPYVLAMPMRVSYPPMALCQGCAWCAGWETGDYGSHDVSSSPGAALMMVLDALPVVYPPWHARAS